MMQAVGLNRGLIDRGQAAYEADVSDRLRKLYCEQGGFQPASATSMFVPMSGRAIEALDSPLGRELQEASAAGVAKADPDELRWMARRAGGPVRQSLSTFDDAAGGVLLSGRAGEMIDLLRANEAMSRLGTRELTFAPSGRMSFPRQTGASTSYWVGERQEIPETEPTTGQLDLLARKLACLITLPNEMLRFGGPTAEAFFRMDMAKSMALEADRTFIGGVGGGGSARPAGLLDTAGVQRLDAGTLGANGDVLEPSDLTKALVAVENVDAQTDRFGWLMRPSLFGQLLERRTSAVASGDREGAYLFPMNRSDISDGAPARLRGHRLVTSTQVPGDRTKGTDSNLTALIAGAWDQAIIARHGIMEVADTSTGDTAFRRDETWFRCIQHLDFALRHPEAFVVVDNLDATVGV